MTQELKRSAVVLAVLFLFGLQSPNLTARSAIARTTLSSGAVQEPNVQAEPAQPNQQPDEGVNQIPTDEEIQARHPIHRLLVQDSEAPDATLTLEQLIAGVADYQQRLTTLPNFLIDSTVEKVEEGAPTRYGHPLSGFRWLIARRNSDTWLAKVWEPAGENFVPYSALWQEGMTLSQEMHHFSIVWGVGARFSNVQAYTMLMGIDIIRDMPGSDQLQREKSRHCMLQQDFIDLAERYVVLPKQQLVDGAWCHVVQSPGFHTMWIDSNLGFVIRQRVYDWHQDSSCERVVYQKDFQEVAPGLSFPFTIIDELYAQPLQIERPFWNEITATSTSRVINFQTAAISEEVFDLEIPVGVEVYDYVTEKQFVVSPADSPPFEDALDFSRRMGEKSWTTIGFGLGALGGLLIAFMLFRKSFAIMMERKSSN